MFSLVTVLIEILRWPVAGCQQNKPIEHQLLKQSLENGSIGWVKQLLPTSVT